MSVTCNCGEHVKKLNQQVSVMRKEIKNLRQLLDSGVRSHRKHMTSLQSALKNVGQDAFQKSQPMSQTERGAQISLEQGHIQTAPIGYISSCFSVKNGTPRQPTVCGPSRATLQIQQRVFNNAEHSLVGLEDYSHVWVIFLFHKNGHLSYKAKVKPPRLNGQRVGVYSTRSPHRPNALGLTLAKLDRVTGDTLHLSEIDMIAGTPVLDIKPYIPDYDSPHSRLDMDTDAYECEDVQPEVTNVSADNVTSAVSMHTDSVGTSSSVDAQFEAERGDMHHNLDTRLLLSKDKSKVHILSTDDTSSFSAPKPPGPSTLTKDLHTVLGELKAYVSQGDSLPLTQGSSLEKSQASDGPKTKPSDPTDNTTAPCYGEEAYSTIAGWIRDPPVASLDVRFTPNAKKELEEFLSPDTEEAPGCEKRPRFRFLQGPEEATAAIRGVLSADPRSVYRRTRCKDRLFFFTLDTADITCWFGQGFTEVLRVTPVVPNIGR